MDEIPNSAVMFPRLCASRLRAVIFCVSRAPRRFNFSGAVCLAAAMNPCLADILAIQKECRCSANEVLPLSEKISGPLLDRIDIQIEVPRVKINELRKEKAKILRKR